MTSTNTIFDSRIRFNCTLLGLLLAVLTSCFDSTAVAQQPNIILINLDDADAELFSPDILEDRFPGIASLSKQGLSFTNVHATTPLCGPSRACLLRAQYAHRSGIRVNQPESPISFGLDGGFRSYLERGYFNDDLSVWMQNAGYRTMMVGKFLHSDFVRHVPVGWDDFRSYQGAKYYNTLVFSNETREEGKSHHLPDGVYRTEAEFEDAIELIENQRTYKRQKPFFLFLNPLGPHRQQGNEVPMIDVAKYGDLWPHVTAPSSPAYDEANVLDGNGPMRMLPQLTDFQHELIESHYRERLVATKSVDDMITRLVKKLEELSLMDNTYLFITSDNGFALGHHRFFGKGVPADRGSKVPLIAVGPKVIKNSTANHLLAHIDIGPTIVRLAGGKTPDFIDGKSFAHILQRPFVHPEDSIRDRVLIENFETRRLFGTDVDAASTSLRMPNALYTEWADGGRDYFDLSFDPERLDNVYDSVSTAQKDELANLIRETKNEVVPFASFQSPFIENESLEFPINLKGIAESNQSIKRVEIAIQSVETGLFWNGTNWVASFAKVAAALRNDDSQLTIWNYKFHPPTALRYEGTYRTWAWAFGTDNSYAAPAKTRFSAELPEPGTELFTPTYQQVLPVGAVLIEGSAHRVLGSEIQLMIRDADTNQFWNGNGFQTSRYTLDVPVDDAAQWSAAPNLPAGSFRAIVDANDVNGNPVPQIVRLFYVE
jgi:arylsulfatase A-like enzyme